MNSPTQHRPVSLFVATGAVLFVVVALVAWALQAGGPAELPPTVELTATSTHSPNAEDASSAPTPTTTEATHGAEATPSPTATGTPAAALPLPQGVPVSVAIPAIGVDAPMTDLGLTASGELGTPADKYTVGWWSGGIAPGAPGPAVLVGHVDWYDGVAVFTRLSELTDGDQIIVRYADGTAFTFAVERSQQVPRDQFPSAEVYGPQAEPVLRILTCGGQWDTSVSHYTDNLIIYAAVVGATTA